MLAIDLSRASLAYAAAQTRALGLDASNMRRPTSCGSARSSRSFDLIESNGVLHHMADPYAGWRVLLSLLRPGGFMRIGLYSEIARWGVVAARAFIARQGYGSTPAEIRRFRHDLMQRDDAMARNIMWFNDFYSMSECRDLAVPHAGAPHDASRDQGVSRRAGPAIPRIRGRSRDGAAVRRTVSADTAMIDLDRWHGFEQDNPHTFANMYRFWVQKAG